MNKYVTMLKTEIKLSFRGMDMVIFALCLPVVMVYCSVSFMEISPLSREQAIPF